jgi:hypothetical protein
VAGGLPGALLRGDADGVPSSQDRFDEDGPSAQSGSQTVSPGWL